MDKLKERAQERKASSLVMARPIQQYMKHSGLTDIHLGLEGKHQEVNASLAVALAHTWLKQRKVADAEFQDDETKEPESGLPYYPLFKWTEEYVQGLSKCVLHGKFFCHLEG